MIREFPNLHNFVRDMYQLPGVAGTVNMVSATHPVTLVLGRSCLFRPPPDRPTFASITIVATNQSTPSASFHCGLSECRLCPISLDVFLTCRRSENFNVPHVREEKFGAATNPVKALDLGVVQEEAAQRLSKGVAGFIPPKPVTDTH